jgi:uncharacterized protein
LRICNVRNGLVKAACLSLVLMFLQAGTSGKGDIKPATSAEVYNAAVRETQAGHHEKALQLYEKAADANLLAAQIQTARIYAAGRIVARDDVRAFNYYRRAAEPNEDMDRTSPWAPVVGEAYLALSKYYRSGLPEAGVAPDKERANQLLALAAARFQSPAAQYELGMVYLAADGVERNPKLAEMWLRNAAQKRYPLAQAELGAILWRGELVKQQRERGLAMLALALDNAADDDRPVIVAKYVSVINEADNDTVKQAEELLKKAGALRIRNDAPLRILPPEQIAGRPAPDSVLVVEPAKTAPAVVPSLNGQ